MTSGDGAPALAGVLSRGSSDCTGASFYGLAYTGSCWLESETGLVAPCADCACLSLPDASSNGGCGCHLPSGGTPQIPWVTLSLVALWGFRRRSLTRR